MSDILRRLSYLVLVPVSLSTLTYPSAAHDTKYQQSFKAEITQVRLDTIDPTVRYHHPTFMAVYDRFLFVNGGESDNIAVLDLSSLEPVRIISLTEHMEPYRIVQRDGFVMVGGAKFITVLDVRPLSADPKAEIPTAIYCMFPCGGSYEAGAPAHGAVAYSVNALSLVGPDPTPVFGIINRETKEGSIVTFPITERPGSLTTGWFQAFGTEEGATGDVRVRTVASISDPDGIAVLHNQQKALVINQATSTLSQIDLKSGNIERQVQTGIAGLKYPFDFIPHVGDSLDIAVTPDESAALVTNARSATVAVVDLADFLVKHILHMPEPTSGPYGIAVSPNGKYAFVAAWGEGQLVGFDIASGTMIAKVDVGKEPVGVVISDNRVLVSNSGSNTVSAVSFPDLNLR